MTTDRQKGRIVISCDTCGTTEESPLGTSPNAFEELWNELRAAGWRAMKPVRAGGEWEHMCPDCKD